MEPYELDELDKILSQIDPEFFPSEFVKGACYTDTDGEIHFISADEYEDILDCEDSLEEQGIDDIDLIVNIELIKEAITHYAELILKNIQM